MACVFPRENYAQIISPPFCDFLRWFGTDLEAGFVIYAENDPKAVFGVSLGVWKRASYATPQIPGCQYTWHRPQPCVRRCNRPVGGGCGRL